MKLKVCVSDLDSVICRNVKCSNHSIQSVGWMCDIINPFLLIVWNSVLWFCKNCLAGTLLSWISPLFSGVLITPKTCENKCKYTFQIFSFEYSSLYARLYVFVMITLPRFKTSSEKIRNLKTLDLNPTSSNYELCCLDA